LTNSSGQHLLGWRTESDGGIQDIQNPGPIELQSVSSSARPSTELAIGFNLTADEEIHAYDTSLTLAANLDAIVLDPTQADFVTDVRFFDSEGGARDASYVFTKRSNNLWDWSAYTDGSEVVTDFFNNPVPAGTNATIARGELVFNRDGGLKFATGTQMDVLWSGGVEEGIIDANFGDYTGGFLFDDTTTTGNMDHADGVMDVAMSEEQSNSPFNAGRLVSGTYTMTNLGVVAGGYNIQVAEPDGTTFSAIMPTTNINRTLEFTNGVTMAVSSAFDVTTWGGGTIDIPALAEQQFDEGRGTDGAVQFTSPYNTRFANQNGFGSGTLASVGVDDDGFVIGSFTNGESKKLWQLVVSVFQDTAELEPVGNNLLRETDGSGRPLYKIAGVGGTAKVVSGALEQSTVDIAQEFSNMIVSQRAFQASSTIISTADQMLNELLQIR
ncbi:MAG: flagellar hook protein FlgE, partial [bacterium]